MGRDRVDALEERVRRLRATVDSLDKEYAASHRRLVALEAAVEDAPNRDSAPTRLQARSTILGASRADHSTGRATAGQTSEDEATDAEVAAAIRAVEDDTSDEAADDCSDDILLA